MVVNVRRFRFWYEEAPKKNGKTPLLSLIGNYLLFADCVNEDGSPRQINLFLCATTRKQAERCLFHAIRQIRNNYELDQVAKVSKLEGFHQIQYMDNLWSVVAANPESAEGVNGHCLADEFYRWKGFEFFNALKWMLASQPEGIFAAITTAGETGENVCRATHEHARDVNSGRAIDEPFLGVIYGASKEDDPHAEETWFKANPSLGTRPEAPLKLKTFRSDHDAAVNEPSEWGGFKRLRLGIWDTPMNGWIATAVPKGIDDWDSGPTARKHADNRIDCYERFTDDDLKSIDSEIRTLAFDLASVRDTVAAVLSVQDADRIIRVRPWFWLPQREAERQKKRLNYAKWANAGHIKLMEGAVINFRTLLNDMIDIANEFRIQRFYFDPLFQAEWFSAELENATEAERVQFPQQFAHYAPCVAECERQIISHNIRHNGNPVLTWQIGNAVSLENANGGKRIVKKSKGSAFKVDGVQAMLMSIRDTLEEDVDTGDDEEIIDI